MIVPLSKIRTRRDEDGVWIAKSALLPGCHAHGRDRGEAILRFQQAAKAHLEALQAEPRLGVWSPAAGKKSPGYDFSALAAWLNPSRLHFGDLNLVGLQNPLAALPPNRLIWGQVSTWTASDVILWGDTVYDPDGQVILWGDTNTTDDYVILWGDTIVTDPDPR